MELKGGLRKMRMWIAMWGENNTIKKQWSKNLRNWLSSMKIRNQLNFDREGFFLSEVDFSYKDSHKKTNEQISFLATPLIMNGVLSDTLKHSYVESLTSKARENLYKGLTSNIDYQLQNANGDFTITYVDRNMDNLVIANDIYATRPIYYYKHPNDDFFCASNDLRTLLLNYEIPFTVNYNACLNYPTTQFAISEAEYSNETFFKGIYRLPPASILQWNKNDKLSIRSYWGLNNLLNKVKHANITDYVDEFRQTMLDVVQLRISDKKTILDVSGGLDSGNILGAAIANGSSSSIFGVNLSFESNDMSFSHDKELVTKLLQDLNIEHAIIMGDDINKILNAEIGRDPMWYIDGPDPRGNPLYDEVVAAISIEVGANRSISGDGGDYVASGEELVIDSLLRQKKFKEAVSKLWNWSDKKVGGFLDKTFTYGIAPFIPGLNERLYYKTVWAEKVEANMPFFTPEHIERENKGNQREYEQYKKSKDFKLWGHRYHYDYLYPRARCLDTTRVATDYMYPFYDKKMIELSFCVPPEEHYDLLEGHKNGYYKGSKQLMRKAFNDVLPDYLLNRKIKTTYAHMARKCLLNEKHNILQLFSKDKKNFVAELGIINKEKYRDHLIAMLIRSNDPNNDLGMSFQYLRSVLELEIWLQEVEKGRDYILERSKPVDPRNIGKCIFSSELRQATFY